MGDGREGGVGRGRWFWRGRTSSLGTGREGGKREPRSKSLHPKSYPYGPPGRLSGPPVHHFQFSEFRSGPDSEDPFPPTLSRRTTSSRPPVSSSPGEGVSPRTPRQNRSVSVRTPVLPLLQQGPTPMTTRDSLTTDQTPSPEVPTLGLHRKGQGKEQDRSGALPGEPGPFGYDPRQHPCV